MNNKTNKQFRKNVAREGGFVLQKRLLSEVQKQPLSLLKQIEPLQNDYITVGELLEKITPHTIYKTLTIALLTLLFVFLPHLFAITAILLLPIGLLFLVVYVIRLLITITIYIVQHTHNTRPIVLESEATK